MDEAEAAMQDWKGKFDEVRDRKNLQDAMDFEQTQRAIREAANATAEAERATLEATLEAARADWETAKNTIMEKQGLKATKETEKTTA
jgi:hypothetical protein